MYNETSLDTLCGALAYSMGIDAPTEAAPANEALVKYIDNSFCGAKVDRVFMYNPDAIAQWVFEKYSYLLTQVSDKTDLQIPFCTVMPSVTSVCYGTMYTGAQPSVHGIQYYEKPVIKIDTLFDALIRNGKKPVIVSQTDCSMSKIYLERDMDYFIYDTIEETNAKACEIILEDKYDFVVVYNKNYDAVMHKTGPESIHSLAQLSANAQAFGVFQELIKNNWRAHKTLMGFAMDHGCHKIDANCGAHGLDMEEDLNIVHCYKCL